MTKDERAPGGDFAIGQLARRAGVAVANIRYYEEIGVLPKPRRSASGLRFYGAADLERLKFVRNFRDLGFPLEQVRALLQLSKAENRTCDAARDLAVRQLAVVQTRIRQLQTLETELSAQVRECEQACLNGPAADCTILVKARGKPGPCGPPSLVFPSGPGSAS